MGEKGLTDWDFLTQLFPPRQASESCATGGSRISGSCVYSGLCGVCGSSFYQRECSVCQLKTPATLGTRLEKV
jgi:hypothetical protein